MLNYTVREATARAAEKRRSFGALLAVLSGLMLLSGGLRAQGAPAVMPADPNATPETRNLMADLNAMRGKKLIFGQHMTATFHITRPPAGQTRWSDVRAATGEWPGMWSFQMNFAVEYGQAERMRENIRFAYSLGAPITICWHMRNPVTGGPYKDRNIDIASVLPGGANHQKLVEKLSEAAGFLETLTDAQGRPIPVLFRPWHEFNLRGYWWNVATAEQYVELYRFTVEYFRDVRGLHNLLYVYNPNFRGTMARGDIAANFLQGYPGDDYIDVLSMDCYGDPRRPGVMEVLDEIVRLAEQRGKLPALAETGVGVGGGYARRNADPNWYVDLLEALKADPVARRIAYVTTWYNKPGQYWVPYAEGVNGYDAFMKFYRDPYTAFSKDVQAMDLYAKGAGDDAGAAGG